MLKPTLDPRTPRSEPTRNLDLSIQRFPPPGSFHTRSGTRTERAIHLLPRYPRDRTGSHPRGGRIQVERNVQLVMLVRVGHVHVDRPARSIRCSRTGTSGWGLYGPTQRRGRDDVPPRVFVSIRTSRVVAFPAKLAGNPVLSCLIPQFLSGGDVAKRTILVLTIQTRWAWVRLEHHSALQGRHGARVGETARTIGASDTVLADLLRCRTSRRSDEGLFRRETTSGGFGRGRWVVDERRGSSTGDGMFAELLRRLTRDGRRVRLLRYRALQRRSDPSASLARTNVEETARDSPSVEPSGTSSPASARSSPDSASSSPASSIGPPRSGWQS